MTWVPEKKLPANLTTGHFTKALVDVEPGKDLIGAGSFLNWKEWCEMWSKHTGKTIVYEEADPMELENAMPGGMGKELADMFRYVDHYGYDGGDPDVVYPWDVSVRSFKINLRYDRANRV